MSDGEKPYRVGLIGLGIMGAPIARRLLGRGWRLTVWNLEPERFDLVRDAGAEWAHSPAAVRGASDVVMLCILGDAAIESVCLGPDGLSSCSGASMLIDLSTTSAETTRRVAASLGMAWLDAPMSGGPQAAEEGTLTIMAGGDAGLYDRLTPVLADLAGNTTLMGPLGAGQMTKVINQAIVGVNYVLMGEVLAMAEAAGIDAGRLARCLKGGMADSTVLQRIFTQMQARDFDPPRSYARQLNKDLHMVEHVAERLKLELPVLEAAIRQYERYTSAGNDMQDGASVSRLYERPTK
jgi:3-hydroxyisobutyrate dehydrogenase